MNFNTLVVLVWAYAAEEKSHGPGIPQDEIQSKPIREMIEAGVKSRSYCVFAMFNMAWRILLGRFRAARSASLAALRYIGGIDGLETYRELVRAAVALSAAQGNPNTRNLAALLVGDESAN